MWTHMFLRWKHKAESRQTLVLGVDAREFPGGSWGSIPPLRMTSLLPHDLCHGRSASRWLLAVIEFQLSYYRSSLNMQYAGSRQVGNSNKSETSTSDNTESYQENTSSSGHPTFKCPWCQESNMREHFLDHCGSDHLSGWFLGCVLFVYLFLGEI